MIVRFLFINPTFLAPRTHKETASFALRRTCDAVLSVVNAVSCNALQLKAGPVNATTGCLYEGRPNS